MWIALALLGGFVGLIAGGELLVRGATTLALAAKVSPLVIGLTVVAFGTSTPELAVSLQSCYAGKTGLAIGNAVGSNNSNILFILGVSALAGPLMVSSRLFKLDIPVMIASAFLLWYMAFDGVLTRVEGIVMAVGLVGYFYWTITKGRKESRAEAELSEILPGVDDEVQPSSAKTVLISIGQLIVGLVLLVMGSDWLVSACVEIATYFGVSELVIGLTVVAIGTSLPELVTSLMAAVRGQRDLAVGNVVGSNILNILCVLGLSAAVAPEGIGVEPQSIVFDIPVMVAVTLVCLPLFITGFAINRSEGLAMFLYFIGLIAGLVIMATNNITPSPAVTIGFVVPLLVITGVSLAFGLKKPTAEG